MNYRLLGRTGFKISEISLGTWQIGGRWGADFDPRNAEIILNTAVDQGINFFDTADVYGDGRSERAIGQLLKNRSERLYVATKCGRRLNPHDNAQYTPQALRGFVEDSLRNMDLQCIDLIQLHCPPTEVYYRPEIFELFDRLIEEGKILKLGVSVEKVEEALKAIEYENVDTIQIIFNLFRHRPKELFFQEAKRKNIGIIARVPLASGLLTGKFTKQSIFEKGDHRFFNRNGEAFDKGETFSGVNFGLGVDTVELLQSELPNIPMAMLALKWILMFEEVSCVIPGASKLAHLESNLMAGAIEDLAPGQVQIINSIYDEYIKPQVHHLW